MPYLIKSVDVSQSYSKNKKVTFWNTV